MQIIFEKNNNFSDELARRIECACASLIYISETDAPVTAFSGGPAPEVAAQSILAQINLPADSPIEEIEAHAFFARLTKNEAWHDEAHRVMAKKFLELQTLLEENLHDLKVFKLGRIRLDIYAVGIDRNGNPLGIKTQAVET